MTTHRRPSPRSGPSDAFVRRTRNPDLPPPAKFEPTKKQPGDIEISTPRRINSGAAA